MRRTILAVATAVAILLVAGTAAAASAPYGKWDGFPAARIYMKGGGWDNYYLTAYLIDGAYMMDVHNLSATTHAKLTLNGYVGHITFPAAPPAPPTDAQLRAAYDAAYANLQADLLAVSNDVMAWRATPPTAAAVQNMQTLFATVQQDVAKVVGTQFNDADQAQVSAHADYLYYAESAQAEAETAWWAGQALQQGDQATYTQDLDTVTVLNSLCTQTIPPYLTKDDAALAAGE